MISDLNDKTERQRRINIVINDCNGIHSPFEAFYIQSVLYAAQASDRAFERFARAILHNGDNAIIVSSIQEALTHAAGLSRFFWPSRPKALASARADRLRAAFQMENSPLENRDLRNALEHFDERLDEFLLSDPVGYFFPGPLVDSHELADESPGQIFRLVDPFEFIFVILGEKYNFLPIKEEVTRISKLALKLDVNGGLLF